MVGGFAVLKDVPKTLVYDWPNSGTEEMSNPSFLKNIFTKPPSAELKPNQKDEDPSPYPTLDPILQAYVEEDKGFEEIAKMNFDRNLVKEVIQMVDQNEYKRRQSPPGVKITHRALGKDRGYRHKQIPQLLECV